MGPAGRRRRDPASIAGVFLFLHDLSEARSRKAFDRIFEEGGRRRR
jgi:hypothetical protein